MATGRLTGLSGRKTPLLIAQARPPQERANCGLKKSPRAVGPFDPSARKLWRDYAVLHNLCHGAALQFFLQTARVRNWE